MPIADTYVSGLNDVLRAFKKLPKEASQELRKASMNVAERHMAPAWRDAAFFAGPWYKVLADSVKVRRDRVPAVTIGNMKKTLSGGGTPTMVRYPSSSGERGQSRHHFSKPTGSKPQKTISPQPSVNGAQQSTQ